MPPLVYLSPWTQKTEGVPEQLNNLRTLAHQKTEQQSKNNPRTKIKHHETPTRGPIKTHHLPTTPPLTSMSKAQPLENTSQN